MFYFSNNSPFSLFFAALCAGVPAAALVTPADVIKTRLQSKPLPGQMVYTGTLNAMVQIYKHEGFRAFWNGTLGIFHPFFTCISYLYLRIFSTARVLRTAPQFAVTLLIYEMLHRIFKVDFDSAPPSNLQPKKTTNNGRSIIRPVELVHRIDHVGGLCFPRFNPK